MWMDLKSAGSDTEDNVLRYIVYMTFWQRQNTGTENKPVIAMGLEGKVACLYSGEMSVRDLAKMGEGKWRY